MGFKSKDVAAMAAGLFIAGWSGTCAAATAFFEDPVGDPSAIVGAPDLRGALTATGDTIRITFDTPYAASIGDSIAIFEAVGPGGSVAQLSFGRWNGGAPTIFHQQNYATGPGSVSLNFLNWRGCAGAGCDFLQISTLNSYNGSPGFALDAIAINGAFLTDAVNVAGAAPEPSTWALMIAAFLGVAARLKHEYRRLPAGAPAMAGKTLIRRAARPADA